MTRLAWLSHRRDAAAAAVVGLALIAAGWIWHATRESVANSSSRTETRGESGAGPGLAPTSTVTGSVQRLVSQLGEDGDGAAAALVALGEPAIPALAAALPAADVEQRAGIAEVLGEIRSPQAVEPLLEVLTDTSDDVRINAVVALGVLGDRRAVPRLHSLYASDDSPQVRYEVLTSLGVLGDPASVPLLLEGTRSADQYTRLWSVDALCSMGAPQAHDAALLLLDDPSPYVRRRVLRSCSDVLTTPAATEAVIAHAIGDPDFEASVWARRVIAQRLAGDGARSDLAAHVRRAAGPLLADQEPATPQQYQAVFLLAELRDGSMVDRLIAAVRAPDVLLRQHATFLLGQDGSARALPGLIVALADPHRLVRDTARSALQALADRGDADARAALAQRAP